MPSSAAVTACWACLDPLAQLLRLGDERGLLVLRRLRDALAVRVLRGAQLFERGDGGAAVAVGGDGLVDGVRRLPARLLRALDQLGIFAEDSEIDHPSSLVSGRDAASRARRVLVCTHGERPRPSPRTRAPSGAADADSQGGARLQPHQGGCRDPARHGRAAVARSRVGRAALLRDDGRRPRRRRDPAGARGGRRRGARRRRRRHGARGRRGDERAAACRCRSCRAAPATCSRATCSCRSTIPTAMVRATFDGDTHPIDVGFADVPPRRRLARGARVRRDGRHGARCRDDRQHERRPQEEGRLDRLRRRRGALAPERQAVPRHVPARTGTGCTRRRCRASCSPTAARCPPGSS